MADRLTQDVLERLARPFRPEQVRWKPQVVTDSGRALAVPYVDPRVVTERLDQVVGGDWAFHWEPLGVQGDRLVIKSSLTILGVTRQDVGEHVLGDREQADPWKSAVSDALKRAAVHFGVGRYLYWLETVWCSYDKRRREFLDEPYIDDEGNVQVRRRQPEPARPPEARPVTQGPASPGTTTQNSASPSTESQGAAAQQERGTDRRGAGAQRSDARPQSAPDRQGVRRQLRETPSSGSDGPPWEGDFYAWAARYLEHQGISKAEPLVVHRWLAERGIMDARLGGYAALADAQGAFIRGVPAYARERAKPQQEA